MAQALVALYAPYCQGLSRPDDLARALDLLAVGVLVGERSLRPEGVRPFELRWQAGSSPLDPAQVALRVAVSGEQLGADYRFELPTHRLVLWLMDALAQAEVSGTPPDLPGSFWSWLILGLPPATEAP